MAKKREKMKLRGFEWDKTKGYLKNAPEDLDHEMPYSDDRNPSTSLATDPPKYLGMPITVNAFLEMIKRYKDSKNLDKAYSIVFSKSSLMRVLSQEGCEYIAFYFCAPNEDVELISLCQQGLKANMQPIKRKRFITSAAQIDRGETPGRKPNDPNLEERGNGRFTSETRLGMSIEEILRKNNIPPYENKELKGFFEDFFDSQAAQYITETERDHEDDLDEDDDK